MVFRTVATTAPVESVTVPVSVAPATWAWEKRGRSAKRTTYRNFTTTMERFSLLRVRTITSSAFRNNLTGQHPTPLPFKPQSLSAEPYQTLKKLAPLVKIGTIGREIRVLYEFQEITFRVPCQDALA